VPGGRPRYEVPRWRAIRQIEAAASFTTAIGQRSVGARITRLRESGSRVLDVLTGEGRAVHGAASVSQHESQASRFSGGVLSGMWRCGECRNPPAKLQ
jgi:hypothetical protein